MTFDLHQLDFIRNLHFKNMNNLKPNSYLTKNPAINLFFIVFFGRLLILTLFRYYLWLFNIHYPKQLNNI